MNGSALFFSFFPSLVILKELDNPFRCFYFKLHVLFLYLINSFTGLLRRDFSLVKTEQRLLLGKS